jgi:hypothetical protein
MSPFEFVFSLVGLLLGLSLAEVLGGLAKAIKARRHAARTAAPPLSLGHLVPMLALFLMLDIAGFWTYAWTVRDEIPPTYVTLVFGLMVIGLYYLAASWVFPEDLADRQELDSHYFEQKPLIYAVVFLCNLLAYAGRILLSGMEAFTHWTWASWVLVAAYFLLLLLAIFVRSRRANTIVLALLLFIYASDALKLHWYLPGAMPSDPAAAIQS